MENKEILKAISDRLSEKMAENIVIYKINEVSSLADYLIICNWNSDTHIKSLADYTDEDMQGIGTHQGHAEGYGVSKWVCLDFGTIMVNIMGKMNESITNLNRYGEAVKRLNSTRTRCIK